MKKIDLKVLAKAMMLTGSLMLGALLGMLLIKYANPIATTVFMIFVLVVFFYAILKD